MTVTARYVAIVAALALAVIHVVLTPEHLEEKPYIGVLFVIGSVLLVVAVIGMLLRASRPWGWWLGALVSFGMLTGYVASRTVGLPQDYKEMWGEPLGTTSLVLEVAFLASAALVVRRAGRDAAPVGAAHV